MRHPLLRARAGLPLFVIVFGAWLPCAHAQSASGRAGGAASPAALAACERAARQTLSTRGTGPVDVRFDAAPSVEPGLSSESQMLRGAGRWKSGGNAHVFSYTCNVDLKTSEAVGLVMRDAAATAAAPPARAPAEPDLSSLSPAACESSAAEILQRRWPRVSGVVFDRATRTFRQQDAITAELRGSGRALPLADSPLTFFEYACTLDPRDGQVLRTRISGTRSQR